MHYAEVVEIRILKCPTLKIYISVVFHPRCQNFCKELCELLKNIEKKNDKNLKTKNRINMQKT